MTDIRYEQSGIYRHRINKTLDYIEKNLEKPMTLQELALVAGFSRFHFNRIFQAMTGETPFRFVQRLRIEKAASLLLTDRLQSIGAIAYACGFSDLAVFSRNFRAHFGASASEYRKRKTQKSNLSQLNSNLSQNCGESSFYFCHHSRTTKWRTNMKQNQSVEVKNLPQMTVAYIRHTGPYKGDEKLFEQLWNRLFAWAGPRGLIGRSDFSMLVIYHDDPNVTLEEKQRMSVCITVPPDTKTGGDIGKMEIAAAQYVVARFIVSADEFQQAWEWLYGSWFPQSGYQPDDKPCFEMYPEEPRDGKFTVDICVPVVPVS